MGRNTAKKVVGTLLGDQGLDDFVSTFQDPYLPMRQLFGNPAEDFADDQFVQTFADPKRRSKVKLKVLVTHQKPVKHGTKGEFQLPEKTFVQFDISDPASDVVTGHSSSARPGMEGYGVFARLPGFIKSLQSNWPKDKDAMHLAVRSFMREIAPPGWFDEVK